MKPITKKEMSDNLMEQIVNISKASAFDILSKHNQELQAENEKLKERIKYLETLIDTYTDKMLNALK